MPRNHATGIRMSSEPEMDPNFESHLSSLLKVGLQDRPSSDLARELRQKYSKMVSAKKKAAETLRSTNVELAAELEELADEISETSEKFVKAAEYFDAWGRPDPELPHKLREEEDAKKRMVDPNYEAHLGEMMKKGLQERSDYDLPSQLRLLKYKQSADVQRLAASEMRAVTPNCELAAELDEIADEIEESSKRFAKLAETMEASKRSEKSTSNR